MLVLADASVIADFAVAAGTAALAIGTFFLALSARAEARDTKRLAAASERQVAWMARQSAVAMPRLRVKVHPDGKPVVEEAEENEVAVLNVAYINYGTVPAQILDLGSPDLDGEGRAATRLVPPGEETIVVAPTTNRFFGTVPIQLRYRSLHGGPELMLSSSLSRLFSDWSLSSEYELEGN